ncbi:hypothetical protein H1230_16785 [Paenibacillus sp. 19GGS1-52]|uniref:DUF6431 domain-containing protein n=1 Tax=Paenibacillus sp. 19GGS1-52 TaxID=2758563 RepID=UPI001EFBC024|nr:DUF6431 domain-containing protein [Paenibacillus sp. 19GGS1-52]ULO04805.1 hypothetical protein H1230_16785 [Paenibacillus sp. 19GGS1-52]
MPCPCCTEKLMVIGSRERKVRGGGGELRLLVIRRLRCAGSRKIHHELPDLLVPYKRYESGSMEQVLTEPEASVSVCAETSTKTLEILVSGACSLLHAGLASAEHPIYRRKFLCPARLPLLRPLSP